MQQQIGFCTTADGARIAYAIVGSGPALLVAHRAPLISGLNGRSRAFGTSGRLSASITMVVRYDRHGCGLSDRSRSDFSLDSEIRTIEAIVKEIGLNSFVLWGQAGRERLRQ